MINRYIFKRKWINIFRPIVNVMQIFSSYFMNIDTNENTRVIILSTDQTSDGWIRLRHVSIFGLPLEQKGIYALVF